MKYWIALSRLENYKSLSRSRSSNVLEQQQQQQQPTSAAVDVTCVSVHDTTPPSPCLISNDSHPAQAAPPLTSSVPPVATETSTAVVATKIIDEPIYAVVNKVQKDRKMSPAVGNGEVSATSEPSSENGAGSESVSSSSSVNALVSVTYATIDDCRHTTPDTDGDSRNVNAAVNVAGRSDPIYESIDDRKEVIYSEVEPYATFRPLKHRLNQTPEPTGTKTLPSRVHWKADSVREH